MTAAGGKITIGDLRNYRPELQEPLKFPLGNNLMVFPQTDGGLIAARIWEAAQEDDRYEDADPAGRYHLLLEAAAQSYQATARRGTDGAIVSAAELMCDYAPGTHRPVVPSVAIREDDGHDGASIVAVDNQGRTVTCAFTMNGPFGSGVVAPGTGIQLANAPDNPHVRPSRLWRWW